MTAQEGNYAYWPFGIEGDIVPAAFASDLQGAEHLGGGRSLLGWRRLDLAEEAGHHPDIDIRYNRVRVGLVTHDAGGLTEKDFVLAAAADELD